MNRLWPRQLLAVFRLEISKTFFQRRGLWIYLLAAIPILIMGGHAIDSTSTRNRRLERGDPAVTREKIRLIRGGMTKQEVLSILPNPNHTSSYEVRRGRGKFGLQKRGLVEGLGYQGKDIDVFVRFMDGTVQSVRADTGCDLSEDIHIYAGIFQFFYLRLAIFFGCVFVFLNLFRGEMLDKSLHYYFLAPVRREIVVAGKYAAGLVATVVIFAGSTVLQLLVYYNHFDKSQLEEYLVRGNGWHDAFSYVGVAALACLGYGSLFLAAGVLIRNPLIPAAVILFWESINGLMPMALRRLSVIYYLRSLSPVEIPLGRDVPPPLALLALNVDPAPPLLAIGGLALLSCAVVYFAARRARTLEITYGAE